MYKEIIMEHYKYPQNKKKLDNPTIVINNSNPSCGDKIELQLKIENDRVVDIGFHGQGCAISQAAASMLTEEVKGKSVSELEKFSREKMLDLLGIELSIMRIKCGLLAWNALKKALFMLKHNELMMKK